MSWPHWFAFQHSALVHLPVAVGLMLPLALLASMRAGRGIRPWWLVCRYLTWWGLLAVIVAGFSGHLLGTERGLQGIIGRPRTGTITPFLLKHQAWALGSILLGVLTVITLHRRRQDHQNLGWPALLTGMAWSACLLVAAQHGRDLGQPARKAAVAAQVQAPEPQAQPAPPPVAAPQPAATSDTGLMRMLDFASLEPVHPQPVKSAPHGLRWIRAWVTPASAEAYRKGEALPVGTLVVLSTQEDRWGRPGPDQGPLYALEVLPGGKTELSFFWGRVPAERRTEVGGQERVHWKGADAGLTACRACHGQGVAPLQDRSRLRPFVKPAAPAAS